MISKSYYFYFLTVEKVLKIKMKNVIYNLAMITQNIIYDHEL